MRFRFFLALLSCSIIFCVSAQASEWPRFRGPDGDGISREAVFSGADKFALDLAWKQPLGSGYSGIAVARGHVVTMYSHGDKDVMVALDPASGKEQWRFEIGASYQGHDGSHTGPISTPLIDADKVFGVGPNGRLFALELGTGKLVWSIDLVKERKAQSPFYGFSSSPILHDGVLIVEAGGQSAFVAGYDPASGEMLWSTGADMVMHQSPIAFRVEGQAQVIASGNTKMIGLDARTGDVLWEYAHEGSGPMGIWSMMPVPAGDGRMLLAHKDEAATMVRLTRTEEGFEVEKLWEDRTLKRSYNIPVYHAGYVYGYNSRILTCVDAETGQTVWRSREPGDGFMVLADGHLVIATKDGGVHVAPASPAGYHEVAQVPLFDELAWTEPSIADGSLFLRSLSEIARVDVRKGATGATAEEDVEIPGKIMSAFLDRVAAAGDPGKTVDEFMAAQESFPIVEKDGSVHFVYRGEGADLAVAGDMLGVRVDHAMRRVEGTDLFYHSMRVEPGTRLNYLFIRDFELIRDPLNPRETSSIVIDHEMDVAFSGGEPVEMSWFATSGWKAPSFLDEPAGSRRGSIRSHELDSSVLGKKHSIDVYLPAGYEGGDDRLPVAYVHGGAMAQERGQYVRALDNLIGRSVRPVIVVFIGETPPLFGSPAPYAQMVTIELIPFIDENYRTIASAEGRASLGQGSLGFPTMLCAFMQPGVFGKVATQSAFLLDFSLAVLVPMLKTAQEQPLEIYMDWGSYDVRSPSEDWSFADKNESFVAMLTEKGYSAAGGRVPAGTGWSSWGNRTDALFGTLFPANATTTNVTAD